MFSGLIQGIGTIKTIQPMGNGKAIIIDCSTTFATGISIGDSINVSGICSTVVSKTSDSFKVQYLEETLNKTTMSNVLVGDVVNLEECLTLASKIGGHIVTGHIDDKGVIDSIEYDGECAVLTVNYDKQFSPYLIPKGSIAINGISLTVVDALNTQFSCHLIPHTIKETNLNQMSKGDTVNLEFDQMGKYLYRFYTVLNT